MEKFKEKLKDYLPYIKRFPLSLVGLLSMFTLIQVLVNTEYSTQDDLSAAIWLHASLLLTIFGFGGSLLLESYPKLKLSNLIAYLSLPAGAILTYCVHFTNSTQIYNQNIYQIVTIYVILFIGSLAIPYLQNKSWEQIWQYVYRLVYNAFVAGAFSIAFSSGFGLALLGFDQLLNIEVGEKIFILIYSCVWTLVMPGIFLLRYPTTYNDTFDIKGYNKLNRYFFYYVALPLLTVYSIILGALMIRIVTDWGLPENQISYLTLVFTLPGTVSLFALKPLLEQKDSRYLNIFFKVYPLFSILVAILYGAAVISRITAYGMTINRLYLVLVGIIVFGLNFFMAYRFSMLVRFVVGSLILVVTFSFVPFINIFSLSESSQFARLEAKLKEDGILVNGQITPKYVSMYDYESKYEYYDLVGYIIENHGHDSLDGLIDIDKYLGDDDYISSYDIVENFFTNVPPQSQNTNDGNLPVTPTPTKSIPRNNARIIIQNKQTTRYDKPQPINTQGYDYYFSMSFTDKGISSRSFNVNDKEFLVKTSSDSITINERNIDSFSISKLVKKYAEESAFKKGESTFLKVDTKDLTVPFSSEGIEGIIVFDLVTVEWDLDKDQLKTLARLNLNLFFDET